MLLKKITVPLSMMRNAKSLDTVPNFSLSSTASHSKTVNSYSPCKWSWRRKRASLRSLLNEEYIHYNGRSVSTNGTLYICHKTGCFIIRLICPTKVKTVWTTAEAGKAGPGGRTMSKSVVPQLWTHNVSWALTRVDWEARMSDGLVLNVRLRNSAH